MCQTQGALCPGDCPEGIRVWKLVCINKWVEWWIIGDAASIFPNIKSSFKAPAAEPQVALWHRGFLCSLGALTATGTWHVWLWRTLPLHRFTMTIHYFSNHRFSTWQPKDWGRLQVSRAMCGCCRVAVWDEDGRVVFPSRENQSAKPWELNWKSYWASVSQWENQYRNTEKCSAGVYLCCQVQGQTRFGISSNLFHVPRHPTLGRFLTELPLPAEVVSFEVNITYDFCCLSFIAWKVYFKMQ